MDSAAGVNSATHQQPVLILRREGFTAYEQVIDGIRAATRASLGVFDPTATDAASIKHIQSAIAARPPVILTVGQRAYDWAQKYVVPPLVSIYAYDRLRVDDIHISSAASASSVMALLQRIDPRIDQLRLLISPAQQHSSSLQAILRSARQLGLEPSTIVAASAKEAVPQLNTHPHQGYNQHGALWLIPNVANLAIQTVRIAIEQQLRYRQPLIGASRQHVRLGALFAIEPNPEHVGQRAARIINLLLQSSAPARHLADELAAQPHQQVQVIVNVASATHLGIDLTNFGPHCLRLGEGP